MATLHISELEAARDLTSLLNRLNDGAEIVIERQNAMNVVLTLQQSDAGEYENWFNAQAREAMRSDDEGVELDTAQAEFLHFSLGDPARAGIASVRV